MIKKIFKILLINIFCVLTVLFVFEFACAFISFNHQKNDNKTFVEKIKKTIKLSKVHYFTPLTFNYKERTRKNIENPEYTKPSIILLGCSFTYGSGLRDDETFNSVLSDYTKRNVFNLGMCCASPRDMLYLLKNDEVRNDLIPKKEQNNIDYFIYTYISDQKRRLYSDVCFFTYVPYFKYDRKLQKFIFKHQNRFFARSFSVNFIRSLYFYKAANKGTKATELLYSYFKEINKEIKKHFKNKQGKPPELVILVYEDYNDEDWTPLKQSGITVINVQDLVSVNLIYRQYKTSTWHPNKNAWNEIVPSLSSRLNL